MSAVHGGKLAAGRALAIIAGNKDGPDLLNDHQSVPSVAHRIWRWLVGCPYPRSKPRTNQVHVPISKMGRTGHPVLPARPVHDLSCCQIIVPFSVAGGNAALPALPGRPCPEASARVAPGFSCRARLRVSGLPIVLDLILIRRLRRFGRRVGERSETRFPA